MDLNELYKMSKKIKDINFTEIIYFYKPLIGVEELISEHMSQYKKYEKFYKKDFYNLLTTDYKTHLLFLPIYEVRAKCTKYRLSHTYYQYYTIHKEKFDGIFTWKSKKDKRKTEFIQSDINFNGTFTQINNVFDLPYNFRDFSTYSYISDVKDELVIYDDLNFNNMEDLAEKGLTEMVEKNSKQFITENTKDLYVSKIFRSHSEKAIRYVPYWVLKCYDGSIHFMDAIYGQKYITKISFDQRYYRLSL